MRHSHTKLSSRPLGLIALLLCAAISLGPAACGDSSGPDEGGADSSSLDAGTAGTDSGTTADAGNGSNAGDTEPGTAVDGASSDDTSSASTDTGGATGGGGGGGDDASSGQPDVSPDTGGGSTEPAAPVTRVQRYARAAPSPRLILEIDSVAGWGPREGVPEAVAATCESLLDKPAGVDIVVDDELVLTNDDGKWTFEELKELVKVHPDVDEGDDGVRIYTMFLDGAYQSPSGGTVLGVAWANRYIAMFSETITSACESQVGLLLPSSEEICRDAERTIWLHEVGHVLGLVNNGLEMVEPHEDPDHAKHSHSKECVMYWAYEGEGVMDRVVSQLAGDAEPVTFDADCIADIEAAKVD